MAVFPGTLRSQRSYCAYYKTTRPSCPLLEDHLPSGTICSEVKSRSSVSGASLCFFARIPTDAIYLGSGAKLRSPVASIDCLIGLLNLSDATIARTVEVEPRFCPTSIRTISA